MTFAGECTNAGAYDPAIQAYQYIIDKGDKNENYTQAKMGQLNVMYQKLVNGGAYTQDDLLGLENKFKDALQELGKNISSITLMQQTGSFARVLSSP